LLIIGPLLVVAMFAFGELGTRPWADPQTEMHERTTELASRFTALMDESARIAADALAGPLPAVSPGAAGMAGRLEGVGILDDQFAFLSWEGRPVEPPPHFISSSAPLWHIQETGVRTRLLVKAGPDISGRFALASFILDTRLDDYPFEALLPQDLLSRIEIEFRQSDTAADTSLAPLANAGGSLLRSPAGDVLGLATVRPLNLELRSANSRAVGWSIATLLLAVLLGRLFNWKDICTRPGGLLICVMSLLGVRLMLSLVHLPTVLLPREIGTATQFGSTAAWGLIASPTDLALTVLAVYLLGMAVRRFCSCSISLLRWRILLVSTTAVALTALSVTLTITVARNSRLPLLERGALLAGDARTLLLPALLLLLLAAAELWGLLWGYYRRQAGHPPEVKPLVVALMLLLMVGASVGTLHTVNQELALERLATEFAPQTLERESRRRLALSTAVKQVREVYAEVDQAGRSTDFPQAYLAYDFWVNGELFHGGYKSSLSFYNVNGDLVSHFGFDLPPYDEQIIPDPEAPDELRTWDEETVEPTDLPQQRLFHAEMPVFSDGDLLGIVVGHLLDEPSNLPFLPQVQLYLSALGEGRSYHAGEDPAGEPHYVLYDTYGRVVFSTLRRPPAGTDDIRRAAEANQRVSVRSGGERYTGLALADAGSLHLLMVPAPGPIERLAATVRLGLLALLLFALSGLLPRISHPRGILELVRQVQHSFRRKLLTGLLIASVLPLIGLALFLSGYLERRGAAEIVDAAMQQVNLVQPILEDYTASMREEDPFLDSRVDDSILYWLSDKVGQDIHVYVNGRLQASSRRELFDSGFLPLRLDGRVQRELLTEGLPSLVHPIRIGANTIQVAYAPIRSSDPRLEMVVAVPAVRAQQHNVRAVNRVVDVILLATVLLVALLASTAAFLAHTVARPVKELVEATGKIAAGNYDTRLQPRTRDEVAELVSGFNSMASSLADQRADLERRQEYMARLLHHATTGVISTDEAGTIITLNPAAKALLAAAGDKLSVGEHLADTLADSPELEALAVALRSPRREPSEPEDVNLVLDHKPRRFRIVCINLPEPSGLRPGTLIMLDDVTEQIRINQLAAWTEMARAIAHEIKNPLTPIQLSTEHLRRLLEDRELLPSTEIEACLETVINQVRALREIAGDFAAYAKLPDLSLRPTDPAQFMRDVISPYRIGNPVGITIEERYGRTGQVAMDGKALSRAVINLIENALQAMPDGGTLTVSVATGQDDGEVQLEIRDTGTGLDPEAAQRLFELYFSTKSAGTGLGLAIVNRAVEAHNGRIEVESEADIGAVFRIILPVCADADI
jgi:signal transduction histidine kinase